MNYCTQTTKTNLPIWFKYVAAISYEI